MKKSATLFSWSPGIFHCTRGSIKLCLILLLVCSGVLFSPTRSDAQCNSFGIDFKQGANRDNFGSYTLGEIHWIGSILQSSNSRYVEGMSTLQRIVMNNLPSCGDGYHKLRIKLQASKAGIHAYDFLTSWDNALAATAAIAPGFGLMPANRADPKLHECDAAIGSCSETACNLITNNGIGTGVGATFRDLPIDDNELNLPLPGDQNNLTNIRTTYETRYGNRTVRVYASSFGDASLANNKVTFVGYGGSLPGDGGTEYIYYDISWVSTSPDVVIEFAAHISVGVDGLDPNPNDIDLGVGYFVGQGASNISGGPYHVIVEDFQNTTNNTPKCEPNLGNLDNQLQGSQVLLIPRCDLTGPPTTCANSSVQYSSTNVNVSGATFLWEIISNGQTTAATITSGNATTTGPITVNSGSVGSYTVKFTITNGGTTQDPDDNVASSCTVTTTVTGGPNVVCPAPGSAGACLTQDQVNTAYLAWLATVSGGGTITHNGGAVGPNKCGGDKTVIFTATNSCGTATCSATFTVTADNTPPGFTGSYADVVLGCNPANPDGSLGSATATDGCGSVTITPSDGAVSSNGCLRARTRTFTAVDGCGNTATTSRTVRWTFDNTPPTFTGSYTDVVLGCNPADPNGSLGSATATDACGAVTITPSDGAVSSDGCMRARTRTFTAVDACGNSATASRTVRWKSDNTPPSFTGSYADVILGCNPANPDGSLGSATATDVCGAVTITPSDGPVVSDGCARSRTRTFTARDECSNTATVSRTVRWSTSGAPPAFTGSYADVVLGCNPANPSNQLGSATATSACLTPVITPSDGPVVTNGCLRSITRTFTANDGCGNTATVSRTVRWKEDLTPPTFTGSYTDVVLGCNPANPDGQLGSATATDGCGGVTITPSDGAVTSDGCLRARVRTFTAIDECGNTATTSRRVRWTFDNTPPTFTGSYSDVVLGCNPANPDGSLGSATATDACGSVTITPSDGAVSSDGCLRARTRTFTAVDACGNSATASRTVRWKSDNTPPSFTGSYADVVLGCNPANPDGSLGSATATDACGAVTITPSDGAVTSDGCLRARTRTFTAIDECGNTATTSRTVRWKSDNTPPTFTGSYADVVLGCNPANPDGQLGSATATDACGGVTITPSDGAVSSDGCLRSRRRTFIAIDECGNTSSTSRTVRWKFDMTPPSFTGTYTDVALGCNPANPDGSLGSATATDACGGVTITPSDGAVSSNGCLRARTRTFTAVDECGNTATTSRTVRWTSDVTPPTINCPSNYTAECGTANPTFGNATASDACGGTTVTQLGDIVVQGECPTTHTKTWRAIDACGNTSTCSQTITVPCCAANCTYTQGAYGTEGGKMCDGTDGGYSTEDFIEKILGNLGGSFTVGCAGHSVKIDNAQCVIDKLPGGGSSGPIPAGDYNLCTLPGGMLKNGRINNALLAQTITLGLNMGINGQLGNFGLQANKWLVTADLEECGSLDVKDCQYSCTPNLAVPGTYIWAVTYSPYKVTDCRMSTALYNALPTKNVAGLYALANSALCGNALPAGVGYSDITNAVDCINNAFDECRAFVEWRSGDKPSPNSFCALPSSSTPCPAPTTRMTTQVMSEVTAPTGLTVSAYPNPFRDKISFVINSRVSGQASLEIYNMLGQRLQTVYNGNIVAGRAQLVDYTAPKTLNGGLIYIFKQAGKQVTGKVLNVE